MNKFCKFKIYFVAVFVGIVFAVGVLTSDYYEFLQEPKAIINYEYQISAIMNKKDKKNWLNLSKEMLLLYPIDKSLILSKKIGVMAYKMVKYDKKMINELKVIYGR